MTILPENQELTPWPEDVACLYREKGYWQGRCLGDLLSDSAKKFLTKEAIVKGDKSWSYYDLDEKANQLATGFIALGLKPQDKVIVQLPNVGEFFEVVFALFRIGVVPIFSLPAHRSFELKAFIDLAKPKAYIIVDKYSGFDYRTLAREVVQESSIENTIVVGDEEEFLNITNIYQTSTLLPPIDSSGLALLQLSGGTTSVPKLIPRTHDDYFYSVRESTDICDLSSSSVYMAVLPIAHNFTMSSPGVFGALFVGATVILSDTGAPDMSLELIEKHRVTHCALVPPLAISWLGYIESQGYINRLKMPDINSLVVLQVGGAKLSSEVANKINPAFKCRLQQVFGMAEGLVNYTPLDAAADVVNHTQGIPISPSDEIRIVNEDDQVVVEGEEGQLLTRGPYTIRGYFKAPEHNRRAFTEDGFYRTGDLVRITAGGHLVVTGRSKDQINRGGEKVSAEALENHLLAFPSIMDASVVAMPDAYLGEKICVYIVMSQGGLFDSATPKPRLPTLRSFLRKRGLAEYTLPDRIEVIDSFPKTHLGKVSKKELRAMISKKLKDLAEQSIETVIE